MDNFYFTFCHNHYTTDGVYMHKRYVKVVAKSWSDARRHFILLFSSLWMPTPMTFATCYEEDRFQPQYYTDGEFMTIRQEDNG